ncbi:MAG TPA: pseudaminic acid synthase [Cryomorphaceae bacterium]|nr:pseudaminic acid synthase [Owenweeksia sp.]HAD96958.1 pseudaminic acid synthase [Cryomorphaceae bacterium]|tara:strand:+ start:188 stop:1231 length:1044 start_codon:yes stop_codon:yes gene_type:complete
MIEIGGFTVSDESPSFIIAELSANHNHDKQIAIDTIRAAKKAGADAIKLQTYTPDTITIDCDNKYFQIDQGTLWDGRTLYDLYKQAYTPWEWHKELFAVAKEEGLVCFSSPFDKTAVDLLEELHTPAYKIASFEIQDIPLIEYVASKKKPVIISTGIATFEDIELAVETCRKAGNEDIIILKCTSAYPAPIELANLRTMLDMKDKFGVQVGLSDHTEGNTVPIVATSLGGKVIEKHFILDRSIGGPDADFSLDPTGFKSMVDAVRDAEKALGKVTYELSEKVQKNRKFARSLFVVKNIKKGEVFTEENVRSIRPGYGLHPKHLNQVLGKRSTMNIDRGTPLGTLHFT